VYEGLFQPMHLLILGGCGVAVAVVVILIAVVILTIRRAPPPAPTAKALPVEDRLAHLARLREQGLVSEDEFRQKRQQLLDEI